MESSKNNGRTREQLSRASMIDAIAAKKSYNRIVQKNEGFSETNNKAINGGDRAMRCRDAGIAPEERHRKELQHISGLVVQDIEGILKAMRKAADQILSGRAAEEIDDSGYQLYLARKDCQDKSSRIEAVIFALDHEEFYSRLEAAAAVSGLCLEQETRLEVELPEAEFEENMITGGFEKYKGLVVEHNNRCLEELMVAVCCRLRERGFAVACVPDEDVIFYLPIA